MSEPIHSEVVILNTALELPADKRAAYLDEVCAGDAALRRQVEALLGAHEQAGGFLEAPLAGLDFGGIEPVNARMASSPPRSWLHALPHKASIDLNRMQTAA
jgi:hypothetical protein